MRKKDKKTVVLALTGGIAAYKAVELAGTLAKHGLQVHAVLTREAQKFVTPLTLEVVTGNPVWTDDNCLEKSSIPHIRLAEMADLIVVAPATANTIAKGANGLADNLVSATLLASEKPVLYVPAMNSRMYQHEATQRNIADLRGAGAVVMDPDSGVLACGRTGAGRYPDNRRILLEIETLLFGDRALEGFRVLVTAGGTRESIDPVRFIGNRSSGKMGAALCEEARRRGATVTLILGSNSLLMTPDVETVAVETAQEMYDAVMQRMNDQDIIIKAAAVTDFRPLAPAPEKIKKEEAGPPAVPAAAPEDPGSGTGLEPEPEPEPEPKPEPEPEPRVLLLEETRDILREVGTRARRQILVGFAAETRDLEKNAREKMKKKNVDMMVANDVSREDSGFAQDQNQVILLFPDGRKREIPLMAKTDLAAVIVEEIIRHPKFAKLAK